MANLLATTVAGAVTALRPENQTTVSKTLALADRDHVVACTNTSAITITIPTDATINFPIGSVVYVTRASTGTVTIAASGVTVNAGGTGNMASGETIECRKRAANNWFVVQRPYSVAGTGGNSVVTIGNVRVHNYTTVAGSSFVVGT
jgi:NaMN:DMB phosphoribosyltransferase